MKRAVIKLPELQPPQIADCHPLLTSMNSGTCHCAPSTLPQDLADHMPLSLKMESFQASTNAEQALYIFVQQPTGVVEVKVAIEECFPKRCGEFTNGFLAGVDEVIPNIPVCLLVRLNG